MGWVRGLGAGCRGSSRSGAGASARRAELRRAGRRLRRLVAGVLGPVLAAGSSVVPVVFTASAAVAVAAPGIAVGAAPARASSGSVLILSTSVNGGLSSSEAAAATAAGATVTVDTPAQWDALTTAQFGAYSAIIIGDPSSGGTCASGVPSDAVSTAATWGAAVTGNVAVLGTATALAGSAGAGLLSDAVGYAVAGSGTGLYVSLNCAYSTAAAGTAVPLLAGVDGGGFKVTGRGAGCPDSGTANTLEADALKAFNGLASSSLASWASPACSVQESFTGWPTAVSGVAYLAGAAPADFTASDGATGQPYVLAGVPASAGTQALAPSAGGEVPAGAASGGANPAAPGVRHAMAGDPVDTESGDFTQSGSDLSVPGFGPALGFTRTYDAALAQQQARAGAPGPMGYGWADNWASSLAAGQATLGDIYTIGGQATDTGQAGPATSAAVNNPGSVFASGSDVYYADTLGNRVEEVPGASGTQWGIAMTAGHVYTIAGSDTGKAGASPTGTAAASSLLDQPGGVTLDSEGNLYIADSENARLLEVPAASGNQRGVSPMTAGDIYVIAGRTGDATIGNDNKVATSSDLNDPVAVHTGGTSENLFIADAGNNRIQEIAATDETAWGQTMTANFVYTVAGSSAGTAGSTGDGGAAVSALLNNPQGMTIGASGDMYIADSANDRIQEVPATTGTQWGTISMTRLDIYTVAGRTGDGTIGNDGKLATSSDLWNPTSVRETNGGNLYIADSQNMRVQEVADTTHTEFGQSMTADFVYTIAGSPSGATGYSGNGGPGSSALMTRPTDISLDSSGDVYAADTSNNEIRKLAASTGDISDFAGGAGMFAQDGNGGSASAAGLSMPFGIASDARGDMFVADNAGNRVQEVAAATHTQFGIPMTAGDVYTVAGSAGGYHGSSGDGGLATAALLNQPTSVAVDPSGNLYIADSLNNRIQEVAASTGDISTFAGSATGTPGDAGNGGAATAALLDAPYALATDSAGDLFIAGNLTNQVQEVPAATGSGMTAGHIYTIAGSTAGTPGTSGDGGPATAASLNGPEGIAVDPAGNIYIADYLNNRVQEIAAATGQQWGASMTKGDIYTIAGSPAGIPGNGGDSGPATAAQLAGPGQLATDTAGDLYITDAGNNRVREIAAASGTQRGQQMTAGDIYNVAGSSNRTAGNAGDGKAATAALLNGPVGVGTDPAGNLYITDSFSNKLREVTATATALFTTSPAAAGITITQPGDSQVTFYSQQSGGGCAAPYQLAATGGYCTLPQDISATLTFSSANGGTYTYSPQPGLSYAYGSSGALESETDAAGNTLAITYGALTPGTGHCPSAATTCDTITAASGRALVIGHNTAGLVTSVTDPLGRQWTYAYNAASDLTSVTDPMGDVTTYTYGAGASGGPLLASDLLTITAPSAQPGGPDAGDATVNVYDSLGRVTSQTDPMGYQTTFNYCVNAADGDCLNTATGSGYVTVTDPDGNTTVDDYQQGTLAAQSAYTGATLTSETDNIPDTTAGGTSGGTLLDTTTADGNGNITTTSYDPAGNITTTVAPDGIGNQTATTTDWSTALDSTSCDTTAQAAATCSASQTGPTPVTPGGVITPPASAPPQGVTWTLYDKNGNQLYATTGVYEPGATIAAYQQTTYQLFTGNSVTLPGTSASITCTTAPPAPSLPCAKINADGVVTQLAYDPAGDLASSATPDGNGTEVAATTYTYDSDGEQTSQTSPDGNLSGANAGNYTSVTAWNADARKTSVTRAGSSGSTATPRTNSYGYDADSNQTTVQDARDYTTTTAFNADDKAALVTDPSGNATLTCYDGDGHTTQTVPPAGVAAGSLSPASCPTAYPAGYSASDRLAADATTYAYDADGNQVTTTTPAPAGQTGYETTTRTYDGDANVLKTTAPPATGSTSQVTVDTYSSAGQLAAETTGYGTSAASTTSYCYDPDGDQTAVVMPDGNSSGTAACETASPWVVSSGSYPSQAAYQTTSSYDSARELVSSTSPATVAAPSGATTASTYDAAGNMLTRTDPDGVTTTWTYTPLNLTATISYSGSSAHAVTCTYDPDGNKTAMTDATGSSSYVYDPFGELTSATNGTGNTTGYSYDADGDTTGITYPLPAAATWAATDTATYGYNHADVRTSVTDFNSHQITITPSADSLPASETLGSSGDTISYTYDPTDTPSAIALQTGSTTLQSFTYTDAPAGNITAETHAPSSASSPADYTYDAQDRVTSMTPGTGSALDYGFDPSGNLTTLPTGATGTYDNDSELTSSAMSGTTTSYAYNADGERLNAKQGTTTIASGTWNGAGQLTSYDSSTADITAATYDGTGLRSSTTTSSASQTFTWNTATQIPELLQDSTNAYIYADGGTPAEQVNLSTGTISYLVTDLLGSVRGIASSTGALTATTSYDAWGNPESTGGLTSYTPFGYATAYTDPSGLLYLINRYYDPATGQFLSVDSAVIQTGEPYEYAGGNPVSNTDPTGRWMIHFGWHWWGFTVYWDWDWTIWIASFLYLGLTYYAWGKKVLKEALGWALGDLVDYVAPPILTYAAFANYEAWHNRCMKTSFQWYMGLPAGVGGFTGAWCNRRHE
jgi:RHS repeat-associated protein